MTEMLTVRAPAPLPDLQQRITAAFEAVMLVRCAQPSGRNDPGHIPWGNRPDGVCMEFSRRDAAHRLLALLQRLGFHGSLHVGAAGIRDQHPIYQVMLSIQNRAAVDLILHHGWRTGLALLGDLPEYLTPRRRRHRNHLAAAAWRAATLAAGYKRQRNHRGFYIGDGDTMTVLVRAGRVLNLHVTAQRRYGCHLVQFSDPVTAPDNGAVRQVSNDPQESSRR
ncbi:MAG TPA: hypothetical protein VFX60_09855 [Micromonospora sp.]|nr:hypothetical protein [Micromonospora sp.]